ncbi:Fmc1p NDAI_0B03600 [Naumovozyma dairenensis CBS 421]|uniref:Uncharacterized protein n=1 Tax=Naumovozyma dairenensis (strain ATCC 10597 / BCRC 20456 / CBS 421 / NBRC 0211 / NRRL Y-12639) TaxID=1071378 RepID=G0W6I3_NAUDC|nr:hypothetical protein NDAI_0B03600 [Naumovozyma dairenensis CBS 421]CCD23394.1 hypothetical protein NDAI_0B03600 [Naumovozyma dairenensis CBS 421]
MAHNQAMVGSVNRHIFGIYKSLIKELVRNERSARIKQTLEDNKRHVSLLLYKKSQILRNLEFQSKQNSFVDRKNDLTVKAYHDLNKIENRIKSLKSENPRTDKSLLFLNDSEPIKSIFKNVLSMEHKRGNNTRDLQHFKDTIDFLKNQREYQQLVELYFADSNLTQAEKIKRTANRVGLDTPR